MKTVLLLNGSHFKSKVGTELLLSLKAVDKINEGNKIKVFTNTNFNSNNPVLKGFNAYLRGLRQTGVISIIINKDK